MRYLLLTVSVFLVTLTSPAAFGEIPERRYLLDEEFSWLDRQSADRLVATAKRAGFNVLVPCVWHGRGVSWRSDLPREPRWDRNSMALADPLAYLIRKAHQEGIEVHPWFTVVLRQREFFPSYWGAGVPEQAFDVHNQQYRAFIQEVILEVVRNYPVDGINLDYIRAMGVCQSANCQQDYHARTGRNLSADIMAQRISADARRSIESWNGRAVGDLVRSISTAIRREKPGVTLSVSSHAGYEPLLLQGTNSVAWANDGLIDLILHIEYAQVGEMRRDLLQRALATLKDPGKLVFMAGNYEKSRTDRSKVWPREPDALVDALRYGLQVNPAAAGIALYEYRFLNEAQLARVSDLLGPGPVRPVRSAD